MYELLILSLLMHWSLHAYRIAKGSRLNKLTRRGRSVWENGILNLPEANKAAHKALGQPPPHPTAKLTAKDALFPEMQSTRGNSSGPL
jgi:hypothetical protein